MFHVTLHENISYKWLEKKLKDYPNAVPILTELMAAYKITGEKDKLLDVMRRLRDINPPPKPEEPPRTLIDDARAWSLASH